MKRNEVEYYGLLISDEMSEKLLDTAKEIAKQNNLNIDDFTPQKNMHITLKYFGHNDKDETLNERKIKESLNNKELGTEVNLSVQQLGFYIVDDTIQNVGLRVDANFFEKEMDSGRKISDISEATEPHITIAINRKEGVSAKAVNTNRCFWDESIFLNERKIQQEKIDNGTITQREMNRLISKNSKSIQFMLDEPMEVKTVLAGFRDQNISFELEDMPLDPEKHPEMSLDEIIEANTSFESNGGIEENYEKINETIELE